MKEVTVIFKSGKKVDFTTSQFETFRNGFGAMDQVVWNTDEMIKQPVYMDIESIDAILVGPVKDNEVPKQDDHPIEDVFGEEIKTDDVYFKFGEHIVLEHNLKAYLIEQHQVECFQAQ